MDRFLRRATPLVLLVLAALAIFEPRLPERLRTLLGDGGILRAIVAVLCLYVLLLVIERERLEGTFRQVLKAFQEFRQQSATTEQKRDAVRILITALESKDPEMRQKAASHLQRLTGQDFGEDAAKWRQWNQD